MRKIFCSLVLLIVASTTFAQDPQLPDVENLMLESDTLSWDALAGATGFNITRNYRYYDTVRDTTMYSLTEPGTYRVVAFNNSGEYGSDYGPSVEYGGASEDLSVTYSYNFSTLLVYQTCKNVGPGETCVARCPSRYTPEGGNYRTVYPRHMSGGACTTSDIVEADAWIGHSSYHCTVPTFSGEVVAQAICQVR